jgi:metal-responsive CopG/Arc/MetJ family transcriptional regulator
MKTAISIPDKLFKSVEDFTRRRKISRSALFSTAVEEYIQHHRQDNVTERLNEVYSTESSSLDPVLGRLQHLSVGQEKW